MRGLDKHLGLAFIVAMALIALVLVLAHFVIQH